MAEFDNNENEEKKVEIHRIKPGDFDVTEIIVNTDKENVIVIQQDRWHISR